MSTIFELKDTCFICGTETEFMVLGSSNSFGSPDLDTRPAPMIRDTMSLWLRECPCCGYVAGSVANPTVVSRQWLQEERYTTCNGRKLWDTAALFYKHYLISLEEDKTDAVFNAALQAAWVCDDVGDEENAIHCRNCALTELEKLLAEQDDQEELLAIRADILRRTGQFDRLQAEYSDREFQNEVIGQIIAFQLLKAQQKDTDCYRVEDATGGLQ